MSAYLYPNLKSKKAYKEAIKAGQCITAKENTPYEEVPVVNSSRCHFEGPHSPEPHKFYGVAVVKDGRVVSIK